MTLELYQQLAYTTLVYPKFVTTLSARKEFLWHRLIIAIVGLTNLYGNLLETNESINRVSLRGAVGDILWYVVNIATVYEIELDSSKLPTKIFNHANKLIILESTPIFNLLQITGRLLVKRKTFLLDRNVYSFIHGIKKHLAILGHGSIEAIFNENLTKIEELYPDLYRKERK